MEAAVNIKKSGHPFQGGGGTTINLICVVSYRLIVCNQNPTMSETKN